MSEPSEKKDKPCDVCGKIPSITGVVKCVSCNSDMIVCVFCGPVCGKCRGTRQPAKSRLGEKKRKRKLGGQHHD